MHVRVFNLFNDFNREACTAGPVTKEQAGSYVLMIARFITSCIAEQIRLAPDKCMTLSSYQNCS